MTPATPEQVRSALARTAPWPVDLDPDDRYVALADLAGVADRISARLGGAPGRVGESTYVLGLAARLWAATLGPAVRDGVLPDPAAFVVRDEQGAVHLGVRDLRGWQDPSPADLHDRVVAVLRPVIDGSRLSPRLLWGNVASALHAAPRVLELPQARPWADDVLQRPPLAGEVRGERRTTCCLFYEAGGGLCGDCVLDRVPSRR